MRSAFTLVEILISVIVLAVISGGALVYLNVFNSRQKMNVTRDEVVSLVKLANNYAKTRQLPLNSTETQLKYVQVQMVGNNLVAGANGIGSTYFSTPMGNESIGVSSVPSVMYFWNGNGFLSHDINGDMYDSDENVIIFVQSKNDLIAYNRIIVDSLGQIRSVIISDGVGNYLSPTPNPTLAPTAMPTAVPSQIPSPTSRPTPTPTPSCGLGGSSCSVHGECCSYYCTSGSCL